MDSIIFRKKIYFKNHEDYLFINVTKEMNGYFIWYESDQNMTINSIIDYHLWGWELMIVKAVKISRMPPTEIKKLIMKRKKSLQILTRGY